MFILDKQRQQDVAGAFKRYQAYLDQNKTRFPKKAYALASSAWYFSSADHKCPHDAWLEDLRIFEPASGDRNQDREISIEIRLLAAYHDGVIKLSYPSVFGYELSSAHVILGHCDWRYDEIRLAENGNIIHEIEWSGARDTARWIIEANDIEFAWIPREL
ncbi:MAG: hypothetical protein V4812_14715 [Pseudomonadota bacterium]